MCCRIKKSEALNRIKELSGKSKSAAGDALDLFYAKYKVLDKIKSLKDA